MKKILLIVSIVLICSSCSGTKKINGHDDTFLNFVVLNKNNREFRKENLSWNNLEGDNFPGIRFVKWCKAEK
ncbi:MAG: hypothetical protein RR191_05655 [Cetobacterium sp.]|uniref:hypothetical protein n=1 Tax=Cetobacterium sp. TaxID=2071632 RepID=UPI002FCBA199